jgi:hypothetical protein
MDRHAVLAGEGDEVSMIDSTSGVVVFEGF